MNAMTARPGDTFVGAVICIVAIVALVIWAARRDRAQAEWDAHVAEAMQLAQADEAADVAALPIYEATAAHIAKHAAESLDGEWAELNRRGIS